MMVPTYILLNYRCILLGIVKTNTNVKILVPNLVYKP